MGVRRVVEVATASSVSATALTSAAQPRLWTELVSDLALYPGEDRAAVRARLRLLRQIVMGVRADITDCVNRCAEFNAELRPAFFGDLR